MIQLCKLLVGQNLKLQLKLWEELQRDNTFSLALTANASDLNEKIRLLPFPTIEIIQADTGNKQVIQNFTFNQEVERISSAGILNTAHLIFHSSGSTQGFKWIFLRPTQCQGVAKTMVDHLSLSEQDNIAITAPLFHAFGFNIGVLASLKSNASYRHFSDIPKKDWIRSLVEGNYTHLLAVPTIMEELRTFCLSEKIKLHSLRGGIIGGASVTKDLFDYFYYEQGMKELTVGYGLTELGPIVSHTKVGEGILYNGDIGEFFPQIDYLLKENSLMVKSSYSAHYVTSSHKGRLHIDTPSFHITGDDIEINGKKLIYKGRITQTIERGAEKLNVEYVEQVLKEELLRQSFEPNFVCFKAQSSNKRFNDQIGIAYIEEKFTEKYMEMIKNIITEKFGKFFSEITYLNVENFPYSATGKLLRQENQLTKRRIAS